MQIFLPEAPLLWKWTDIVPCIKQLVLKETTLQPHQINSFIYIEDIWYIKTFGFHWTPHLPPLCFMGVYVWVCVWICVLSGWHQAWVDEQRYWFSLWSFLGLSDSHWWWDTYSYLTHYHTHTHKHTLRAVITYLRYINCFHISAHTHRDSFAPPVFTGNRKLFTEEKLNI